MANAQPLFGLKPDTGNNRERIPSASEALHANLHFAIAAGGGGSLPTPTFASLESAVTTRRASSMATGFVLQAALVSGVLLYAAVAPRFLPTQFSRIELVAPAPDLSPQRSTPTQPEKSAPVHPSIAQPEPQQQAMLVRLPQRVKPAPQPEAVQPVAMPAPNFDARIIHELPSPRQVRAVTSAGFGGSSAAPTLDKVAPSRVQTGGFGDPNGVPLNANGSGRSNIAAVGSFDMPRGAGYGNGTGGAHGARGSVASSGFGNGTAGPGSGTASRGNVQTAAGFNRVAAAPETKRSVLHASTVPVTILSKPSPVYTEAARARRIEGEVLLNVTFSADGRVHVQGILRGLGYGLDEAAVRAVQGMKFTPATRDGHAVDSPAVLHVVFQLS